MTLAPPSSAGGVTVTRRASSPATRTDTAAGAVAGAIGAKRLLMLTDVPGVMDDAGNVLASLTKAQAKQMIGSGAINGGMIPKVETCIDAVEGGVGGAVILDGRVPHAVLLELFTEHGAGTLIS